jgi:transcriptional regulator with XRE-family HTH domain
MTAKEIKILLKAKKLSQRELSRRWKKSLSAVHFLIEGKLQSAALERRLARTLGVSVEEIRDGKEN